MKFFGKELKFNENKVYHAGDKPTPSEIGAAAASHGTHVTWATTAPKANGTAAVGTVDRVAREDHVHPLQTTVSGNAGTATKLQTARTITLKGNANGSVSFDGSGNVTINTHPRIFAGPGTSGTSGYVAFAQLVVTAAYANRPIEFKLISRGRATAGTVSLMFASVNGTDPALSSLRYWGTDYGVFAHKTGTSTWLLYCTKSEAYDEITLVGHNYGSQGVTVTYPGSFITTKPTSNVTNASLGGTFGHANTATSATKATQDSAGQQINTTYIKGLSVSGKTITYTKGDGTTGTITTQDTDTNTTYSAGTGLSLSGTTFNHKNSVTAGTAQGDASKTLSWGGTFTIPTITYDAQGHITGKGTTTMTMPANPNSDTKVTNTLNTTAKAYVTGTTSSSTNTGTQVFDTGVYLDTTAGMLTATTFKGALSGNATTATTLATTRTINGTSFNGSANITTANWGTARTLTIGNTGKSVNGSANISWSLSEIGAFPVAGGTITGDVYAENDVVIDGDLTAYYGTTTLDELNVYNVATFGDDVSIRDGHTVYIGQGEVYHPGNKPTISDIGALGAKTANGYEGMTTSAGSDSSWIRTTNSGIIPYQSGGASSLGTSSWPFANVYTRALATSKINAYSYFDEASDGYTGFAVHFKGTDAIYGAYDYTGMYLYFDTFLGYTGLEVKDPSSAVEIWGGYYYGTTYSGSSTARFAGILPYGNKNNTYALGSSSYRWSDVYCTRGAFNGSDKSLKEDIKKISNSQTRENSSNYVTSEDLYNHVKNSSTYTFKYKGTDNHVMGVIANEIPDNIFNLLGKMSKTEEEYQQEKALEDNPKIKERYKALKEHGEYDKEGREDRIDRETGLTYSEIKNIAEGNYTAEAPVRLLNPASQVAMLQEVLSMSLNKIEQLEERIEVLENN